MSVDLRFQCLNLKTAGVVCQSEEFIRLNRVRTGVSDHCLTSVHCWVAACRPVLVAGGIVLRVLTYVASQTGDT